MSCGLFNKNEIEFFEVTTISSVEVALEICGDSGDKISIERDGNEIFSFRMSRKDTVVYDSGLNPNTSYIWKAINKSSRRDKNKERQATTLTTTSSDFTWQTFSFGDHSSSTLYGVSIIDENNIWAVGEIYRNDSTGQSDDDRYNAIHWNGSEWVLKRIPYIYQGTPFYNPIQSIFSFNVNSIFYVGNGVIHFDGSKYEPKEIAQELWGPNRMNEIWGVSSQDFHIVGNNGSIAHYNGETWQKIESSTELDIEDIHGNEEQGVVAVASKRFETLDKEVFRIKEGQTIEFLSTEGIPFSIQGIWFDKTGVAYVVGSGMYKKPSLDSSIAWKGFHQPITNNYLQAIDANALNDIVVSGDFGELLHFNGEKWKSFQPLFDGNLLYDIDIEQNVIVAVGYEGNKAFIAIGFRE
tara:strand:- start:33543 stop:34769 length:1227 start_codon:yes stop_codon:yes gene_type:complete